MPRAATPDFTLTAWIDESVIVGREDTPGTYTMAAAIADPTGCDDIRDRLRSLTLRRSGRLHWAHESPKKRDAIASLIAGMDLAAVVVVGTPMHGSKQERVRRCCLERILYELAGIGVTDVLMESRSPAPDRRDVRLVDSARNKGILPAGLLVNFARPTEDPMLWIPDAVAGAVTADVLGERRWMLALSEILTRHDIAVR
jgi:hypothetical protein